MIAQNNFQEFPEQQAESMNDAVTSDGAEENSQEQKNIESEQQSSDAQSRESATDEASTGSSNNTDGTGNAGKILAGVGLAVLGGVALAGGGGGGGKDNKGGSGTTPTKVDPSSKEVLTPIQKLPKSPVLKDDPISLKNNQLHAQTEPGNTVIFYIEGKKVGQGIADDQGNASVDVKDINDGNYAVTAVSQDSQGKQSPASEPHNILIDRVAPKNKSLDVQYDDDNANNVKAISGETDLDAKKVRIRLAGESKDLIADVVDGKWSYSFEPPLKNTGQSFDISVEDIAGNVGEESQTFKTPSVDEKLEAPKIDGYDKGYINATDKKISANTKPNTTVNLIDKNGNVLQTETSDSTGKVNFNFDNSDPANRKIKDGSSVFLQAEDGKGNKGELSRELIADLTPPKHGPVQFDKDTGIFSAADVEKDTTVSVYLQGQLAFEMKGGQKFEFNFHEMNLPADTYKFKFVFEDAAGNRNEETREVKLLEMPKIEGHDEGGYINGYQSQLKVKTTQPNTKVQIIKDGKPIALEFTNDQGEVIFDTTQPKYGDGSKIFVRVVDDQGNSSAMSKPLTIDFTPPPNAAFVAFKKFIDSDSQEFIKKITFKVDDWDAQQLVVVIDRKEYKVSIPPQDFVPKKVDLILENPIKYSGQKILWYTEDAAGNKSTTDTQVLDDTQQGNPHLRDVPKTKAGDVLQDAPQEDLLKTKDKTGLAPEQPHSGAEKNAVFNPSPYKNNDDQDSSIGQLY